MREVSFEVGKRRYTCNVPESWMEMSERQFLAFVGKGREAISDVDFWSQFFSIPETVLRQLDLYYLYVLSSLLSFTRKVTGISSFFLHSLELKNARGELIKVFAPNAKLEGMSFQQFMTVDTFYGWHVQTGKHEYLLSMCCCLYLREGEDFFKMEMDERLECWRKCDEVTLQALLVQWSFIKTWLSRSYAYLFPGGEDAAVRAKTKGKGQVSNTWIEIFDTLVADDLTRIESYKRLECMDVLRIVNGKIKQQKQRL